MPQKGFKSRLFRTYAVMMVLLVAIFSALLFAFTISFNRETELKHQKEVFESHFARLESILAKANNLAIQVASNHEILNVFIPLDEPYNVNGGGNYFDDNLLAAIRIGSILAGINGVDEYAERISVYNRYGDYVSTGRLYESPEHVSTMLNDISALDGLLSEIRGSSDNCAIIEDGIDRLPDDPADTFISLYRLLSYTDTSRPYGFASVQLRATRLMELGIWNSAEKDEYFIISDRHSATPIPLMLSNEGIDIVAVYASLVEQLAIAHSNEKGLVELPYRDNGKDVILLAARPHPSDWILVRALPVEALSRPYQRNYLVTAFVCFALLAFLLWLVGYIAERISRPIRQLSTDISEIGLRNMSLPNGHDRYTTKELAALDEAFRHMLERLDQSIAVEMQAYMRALQAQMNPHFLYNTLSVIIASSETFGDDKTASMCTKLTSMLRYISGINRDTVTLAEEIEHTRNYLDLMKERYEHLFSYEIITDEQVLKAAMPRVVVQPLAENCFTHGFHNEPPWHIRIEAQSDGENWLLRVLDNGVGSTIEQLATLDEQVSEYLHDIAGHYQELSLGGMGLINTLLRLTLMLGEPVRYHIANRPDGGLAIEIGGRIYDPSINL